MAECDDFGPLESAEMPLSDNVAELKKRISELEEHNKKAEVDFGQKRARFKEIFLQKEDELKVEKEKRKASEEKVAEIESQLKNVQGELDSIKAAVAYSESNKHDEMEKLKRHYEQEIASLNQLMKEVGDEASRSTALQYQTERVKLQKLNEKYEEEVNELRNKLGHDRHDKLGQDRDGILSSLAKQIKQMAPGVGGSNSSLNQEHENLEDSMKKAQADAEMLKSVVVPLEEEISTLKYQLQCAQEKIQELKGEEGRDPSPGQRHMTPETQSLPDLDQARDPEERIKELLKYLQTEKASRKDLEMYVAVLTTQKNILQDEADKNKGDLDEVCAILEEEKKAHEDLRQTWQMANDQFLESQRLMMMDLQRMESVLSAEQQRQIAEMQKKDQERDAQEKKVKDLEEMRLKQQRDQEERRKQDALKKVEDATEKLRSPRKSHSDSIQSSDSRGSSEDLSSHSDSIAQKSSSADAMDGPTEGDSFLDSQVEGGLEEGLRVQISPEKTIHMPHLSETQLKALTDPTPELEARQSLLKTAKRTESRTSLEGRRLVSDKEWDLLQQQLKEARAKLGRPCDMCNNYEAQLQNVQDEYKKEQVKAKSLERRLNSEIQAAENRQKYIDELESSLKEKTADMEKQILMLTNQLQECEKYMTEVRQQYTSSVVDLQSSLLTKLQEENDSLVGKHSKNAQQLQNEDINLPNNMEMLLLKYREEIIQAKVAKEHTEETLKSELMFLKTQVQAEQQEKTTLEETLTQDINNLQEKLVMQESLKSELERESSVRAEAEAKLRETDQSLKSIQAKSKQLISALQKQLEEESNVRVGQVRILLEEDCNIRTKLEADVQKYRNKVQSLQMDLENSEAVQRDFVKLSQSLQIQLEKIRQAENEVRWQHEEDVEECTHCKQAFSVTKRKHHCRHCGKIFCSECLSKIVTSGPNSRQSRVCDICHTILVNDAMPYFSTDPPNTPD
ncbi:hypothetical protein FSP39_015613 [Pinctada imbricata]|uniref:FYVE-type domain-containing protein n=1 Tax=Pinctada imbricata TaxID=66713 RepID=A0AA88XFL1_PINIB|nr:hypothetical protein FSP39_015613 [Pinctada imbricata]